MKEFWNKVKGFFGVIVGALAAILAILGWNAIQGKRKDDLIVDGKVASGASKDSDEDRKDVKKDIQDTQKDNEDVIEKNKALLEKLKGKL